VQIEFEVEHQRLALASEAYIVAGQERFVEAHFKFLTDDWDTIKEKLVFFERDDLKAMRGVDIETGNVYIPTGCTANEGVFRLTLVGKKSDSDEVVATTSTLALRVREHEITVTDTDKVDVGADYYITWQELKTWADMAQKWAESGESPDGETDDKSPTGYTQSSKTWADMAQKWGATSKEESSAAQSAAAYAKEAADRAAVWDPDKYIRKESEMTAEETKEILAQFGEITPVPSGFYPLTTEETIGILDDVLRGNSGR